jgi:hypothetical protein
MTRFDRVEILTWARDTAQDRAEHHATRAGDNRERLLDAAFWRREAARLDRLLKRTLARRRQLAP